MIVKTNKSNRLGNNIILPSIGEVYIPDTGEIELPDELGRALVNSGVDWEEVTLRTIEHIAEDVRKMKVAEIKEYLEQAGIPSAKYQDLKKQELVEFLLRQLENPESETESSEDIDVE